MRPFDASTRTRRLLPTSAAPRRTRVVQRRARPDLGHDRYEVFVFVFVTVTVTVTAGLRPRPGCQGGESVLEACSPVGIDEEDGRGVFVLDGRRGWAAIPLHSR